jgi:Holliday junction resolvase
MGKASRDKGARREAQLANLHRELGIKAERVPLSGAARYRGNANDVDVYALGQHEAPLVCEVKARGDGDGFKTLERWLADADAMFLIRDRATPLVVLPWPTWQRLLLALQPTLRQAA